MRCCEVIYYLTVFPYLAASGEHFRRKASHYDLDTAFVEQLERQQKKYWMVTIPSNVNGEVDCDVQNGLIRNPLVWESSIGNFYLPEVDCLGLNTAACCSKFIDAVRAKNIPLTDIQNNRLSCFVEMDLLILVREGKKRYVDHEWDPNTNSCSEIKMSHQELEARDWAFQIALQSKYAIFKSIFDTEQASCATLTKLQQDLLFLGRAFPEAMTAISKLFWGVCDEHYGFQNVQLTNKFISGLEKIYGQMSKPPHFAKKTDTYDSDDLENRPF